MNFLSLQDNPPHVIKQTTLQECQRELSNVSVHKKRRGIIRRIKLRQSLLEEQQSLRGLKRCRIIKK